MGELFEIIEKQPINFKILDNLGLSAKFKSFLKKLLNKDPDKRPSIQQVEKDPWITGTSQTKCCIKSNNNGPHKKSFQYQNNQELIKMNAERAKKKSTVNKLSLIETDLCISKEIEQNNSNHYAEKSVKFATKHVNILDSSDSDEDDNNKPMDLSNHSNVFCNNLIKFIIKNSNSNNNSEIDFKLCGNIDNERISKAIT